MGALGGRPPRATQPKFRGRRTKFTDIIYPNGREVEYGYGTAGAVDDVMSRLETIGGTDGTYSQYTYLGAGGGKGDRHQIRLRAST